MKFHVTMCVLLLAPQVASAQPTAPIAAVATDRAVLRTGTEVQLRLLEEITTKGKKVRVGQRVHFETAETVVVQGMTVVPVGSPAIGEITEVINKGMWGKSGHVTVRVLYMTVGGRQIRLSGTVDDKGVAGGVGAVAVSAIVFLPAGFFMTGTSAKLPIGTIVKSFIDEDVVLDFGTAAPMVLNVGAPAAAVPASVALAPAPTSAPIRLKAKTPSGFCYDVPKNYVGLGSIDKPAITSSTPACSDVVALR